MVVTFSPTGSISDSNPAISKLHNVTRLISLPFRLPSLHKHDGIYDSGFCKLTHKTYPLYCILGIYFVLGCPLICSTSWWFWHWKCFQIIHPYISLEIFYNDYDITTILISYWPVYFKHSHCWESTLWLVSCKSSYLTNVEKWIYVPCFVRAIK